MQKALVLLNGIERVKNFNMITSKRIENVDLQSGRYVIDAKSIMGCFSLNLSKPVELLFHSEDEDAFKQYLEQIKDYVVKE